MMYEMIAINEHDIDGIVDKVQALENIEDVLNLISNLSRTKRRGFDCIITSPENKFFKGKVVESVAAHTYKLCMIFMFVKEYYEKVDFEKCIKMILVHDLAEAVIQDFIPLDQVDPKCKYILEKKVIHKLFSDPKDEKMKAICLEMIDCYDQYADSACFESKLIHGLDKLDFYQEVCRIFNAEKIYQESKINPDSVKQHHGAVISEALNTLSIDIEKLKDIDYVT